MNKNKRVKIIMKSNGVTVWMGSVKEFIESFNGGLDADNRKNFYTLVDTEGMDCEEFELALRHGLIQVNPEFSHSPSVGEVTMNGRYSCE